MDANSNTNVFEVFVFHGEPPPLTPPLLSTVPDLCCVNHMEHTMKTAQNTSHWWILELATYWFLKEELPVT